MHVSRAIVQVIVVAGWLIIIPTFFRGGAKSGKATRRDSLSIVGILIQMLAFSLSWMGPLWIFVRSRKPPDMHIAWAIAAIVLAFSGSLLVSYAIRTLGKQWSLAARITEGHQLVTQGPYSIVRNPIYTGMWGLQLGTCMAFSAWWATYWMVAITALVYYAGTMLRVSREEKLLRAEFGSGFDDYARRVPALIPLAPRSQRPGTSDQRP